MAAAKSDTAFRTIGELADEVGLPQHVLRYWEGRFPQLRPLQRAGKRRYYRPEDVALVHRIHGLLNDEGYTVKGVQRLLEAEGESVPLPPAEDADAGPAPLPLTALRRLRDRLAGALLDDEARDAG